MPITKAPGYKNWLARFTVKGRRYRRSTPYPANQRFRSKAEAWAEALRREIESQLVDLSKEQTFSLAEAHELFCNSQKNDSKTQARLKNQYELLISGGLEPSQPVADLTNEQLFRVRATLKSLTWGESKPRPYAPATINRALTHLSAVVGHLSDIAEQAKTPSIKWSKIQLPEPDSRDRYLTPEDFKRLYQESASWLRPMLLFAVATGLRKSEVHSLRWSQIDMDRRQYKNVKIKGGRLLTNPLSDAAMHALEMAKEMRTGIGNARVFVYPRTPTPGVNQGSLGKPISDSRKAFESALRRAEIDDFSFHDLRHTFAVWFLQNGGKVERLQELLGHRDIKTTMRYVTIVDRDKRDDLTALSSAVLGAVGL